MRSMAKCLLTGVFLFHCVSASALTGLVEDFNDNNLVGWTPTGYYALTEENQELRIDATKRNNSWASFTYQFWPDVVDLTANPYITVRVKSDVDLNLNFSVWDNTNSYAYPVIGEFQGQEIVASDDYETYCFNFSGISGVDITNIYLLNFVCNPGTPTYSGTVYFDDLRIGSEAQLTPSITNVPTQQHVVNAPKQTVYFRGVSDGSGSTSGITISAASSDAGLIPHPTVVYTPDSLSGYLYYTPVADQVGTAVVSVTVSATSAQADNVMTFDVEVEQNMAPHIDPVDDQNAKAGFLRQIELTGIDDGNPNARQSMVITAASSNPALIADPTVEYTSDDFTAVLRYTPALGQTGSSTITVTVQDDGGTGAGGVDTNQITFDANVYEQLNYPPTIDSLMDISILQDDTEQVVVLTGIGDGDADANQTVSITASSSDTNVIPTPTIVYASPDSTGQLRFTPAAGQTGDATITVLVSDDGGLPNNNGDETTEITFDIQVRVRPITGFEDDFEDGIIDPTWLETGEGAHTCTEEGGALKIVIDKVPTGNQWAGLWYAIPNELDISEYPYISITMKTNNPTQMLIFLWDYQDHYNTAETVWQSVGTNYVEYYFDFTGKTLQGDGQEVDISRLKALLFNFDPGGLPLYQGTFWFDDLRVGELAHTPFVMPEVTIYEEPDYAIAKDSGQQVIELTGISDGNDGTNTVTLGVVSSNTSLIPTPVASTVVDGNATLTYTPTAGATGQSTITVTASAAGSNSKQISFTIDVVTVDVGSAVTVNANLSTAYQQIDGFGAFLGWGPDLLIPYVKDIGMSMPRFGVIDIQFEPQNDNSDVNIINLDGFNLSALNIDFMKHIKEQADCVDKMIVTMWSPPAWMKKNKCLQAESWAQDNILQPHFYEEYAESMVALIKAVKRETGIDLYAVSLQNEPQFNEPYASCVILWEQYRDLVKVVGPRFEAEGITTKLFFPEALLAQGAIDDYIHTLNANPVANQYMDIVAVHNYDSDGINVGGPGAAGWANIWSWAQETPAKPTWMTETSGHPDSWDGALMLAGNIYNALYYGNASAWVFWSFNVTPGSEVFGLMVNTEPTSRYYVSKQYYKYVRPGAVRVEAVSAHSDILSLAFHHDIDNTVTLILINRGSTPRIVNVTGSGLPPMFASYTTSEHRGFEQGLYVTDGLFLTPASSLTTLYGTLAPPGPPAQATNPNPPDAATDVGISADLSWTAGAGATSHDVYFGSDANAVASADHNDPQFQDNQAGRTFAPGLLSASTIYYWRIDEVNPYGTTLGDVWSFTTVPPIPPTQATNPYPTNGAMGVGWDTNLSWTAGTGADSHDVYFGTDANAVAAADHNSPEFKGSQISAMYEPGTMTETTDYYWRIDEENIFGTTAGEVWSFTTAEAPPPPPGQLMVWDFAGEGGSASSTADSVDPHIPLTPPSGVASIGPGLTPFDYLGNALTATNQTATTLAGAITGSDYFSWTIAPASGYQISLTSIDIRPVSQDALRTFTLFSSVDGFDEGDQLGSFTAQYNMNAPLFTLNIAGHENLTAPVEFRLYIHGQTGQYQSVGMGNGDVNDLIIKGTALPIEPVPPGQASDPQPGAGATDVDRLSDLSWTAGWGAASHDVYFDTDAGAVAAADNNSPQFKGNHISAMYDPGVMDLATTYYWRIDEKNAYGTTTGSVWNFTTAEQLPIEFDAVSSAHDNDDGGTTLSFSHTIGDGNDRILVVGLALEDDVPASIEITGVTYYGVAMILVPSSAAMTGTGWLQKTAIYYLLEEALPSAGSYTVEVTFAGTVLDRSAGAVSLFNVAQVPPKAVATSVVADPGAQTIATDISTLTDGAWVIDVVGSGDPGSFAQTGGMTERWDVSPQSSTAAGSTKVVSTAGMTTLSWQHTNVKRLAHSLAAFAPVSADYRYNFVEFAGFADRWRRTDCDAGNDFCEGADQEPDGDVDLYDFKTWADGWLATAH